MKSFASKLYQRVSLFTISMVIAVSSLASAVPVIFAQTANAVSPDGVVTNDTTHAAFASIQAAINAAVAGNTIEVGAGTYTEDVTINKSITLEGAGASSTFIDATGANTTPLTFATSNATVTGFTIGHTADQLKAAGTFNNNGVAFNPSVTGDTLSSSTIQWNRNGIYINNVQNNTITDNTITNNRTGIALVNTVTGTKVTNNDIVGNWTLGLLTYSATSTLGTDYSTVQVTGNTFDQNWYTELELRDTPASAGTLDVTGNTFTDSPVTFSTADASDTAITEPAFPDPQPVALGGTATGPVANIPTLRTYNSGSAVLNYTTAPTNLGFHYTIDGQSDNGATLPNGAFVNSNKPTTYHAGGSLNLAWTAPAGTVTGYQILVTNPDGSTQLNYQGPNPYTWLSFSQQGKYTYQVRAEDGNFVSPYSTTYTITYDSIAPVVTVTPVAGSLLHGTETFHITVNDANLDPATLKHVWVYLYSNLPPQKSQGANVDLSTGSADFTVNTNNLVDGLATLDVGKLADAAGNFSGTGDSYFKNYVIDNTAPAAPLLTFPANGVHRQSSNTNHSDWSTVTDLNGPVTYYYESAYDSGFTHIAYPRTSQGTNTSILNPGEPEGTYYWHVQACDAAGNCSPWSDYRSIVIDNTAPTVTVDTLWTSDSTPELTGTINDPTAHITVKVDGHTYNAVNHGSTWTAHVTHSISDGVYNVVATASDAADNVGTDSTTNELTVDAHAPKAPGLITPFNNSYSNSHTVQFVWLPALAIVNAPLSYALQVASDSSFNNIVATYNGANLFSTQNLADGVYYARVMDTDTLGGSSPWSGVHKFTIDTVKPTVSINSPSNNAVVHGTVVVSGTASDDTNFGSYTWTIKNASHHTVYTHTSHNSTVASYNWNTNAVSDGDYTISLEAVDAAGNSQTDSVHVIVDNSAPTGLANLSPADGTVTTTANATSIDWTDATDAHGPVTYYYESSLSSVTNSDGSFVTPVYQSDGLSDSTIATPNTPEGTYYWHVRAVDSLGNSTAWTGAWELIVDDTAPAVPTNGTPNGTFEPTNEFDFNWDGVTDPHGPVTYEYQATQDPTEVGGVLQNNLWKSATLTDPTIHSTGAGDGVWYWQVRAIDGVGNTSDWSAIWTTNIDTTNPTATLDAITSPTGGPAKHVSVTGNVSDANLVSYEVTVTDSTSTVVADSGVVGQTTSGAITPFDWNVSPLASGDYTVNLIATDAAGHTSTIATQAVTVDNTAPALTVGGYTGTSLTPTITGTTDSATDIVTVDGVNATVDSTANNEGTFNWTFTLPTQSVGTHTITVVSTDLYGNATTEHAQVVVNQTPAPAGSPAGTQPTNNTTITPSGDNTSNDAGVLGAQTNQPSTNNNTDQGVKGASDTKSNDSNAGKIFGLAWYWWLLILAAIAAIIWWIIAAARRRQADQN